MTMRLEGNTSLYLGIEGDVGESFNKCMERRLWWRRVGCCLRRYNEAIRRAFSQCFYFSRCFHSAQLTLRLNCLVSRRDLTFLALLALLAFGALWFLH